MTHILQQQFAAPAAFVQQRLEERQGDTAELTVAAASAAADFNAGLSEADRALIEESDRALKTWRASAEHQAFLAALPERTVDELRDYLDGVVRGPIFARTLELSTSPSLSSLVPQSISVGLAGQIEVIVGAYASFGYMIDVSLDGAGSAVYLLGALAEGAEVGIDIAEQVGLWLDKVDDVSGSYIGGELEVDEAVGITGFVLLDKGKPKAVMIDVDEGIGDGASALEFYMLTYETSHDPVAQPPATHMVILSNLSCKEAGEGKGDGQGRGTQGRRRYSGRRHAAQGRWPARRHALPAVRRGRPAAVGRCRRPTREGQRGARLRDQRLRAPEGDRVKRRRIGPSEEGWRGARRRGDRTWGRLPRSRRHPPVGA